jgi:hypothetical protein
MGWCRRVGRVDRGGAGGTGIPACPLGDMGLRLCVFGLKVDKEVEWVSILVLWYLRYIGVLLEKRQQRCAVTCGWCVWMGLRQG